MNLPIDTDGVAPMAIDDAVDKAAPVPPPRRVVGQPVATPQPSASVPAGAAELFERSLAAGASEVTVTNGVVTASARSRGASPPRPTADAQERAASEQVTATAPPPAALRSESGATQPVRSHAMSTPPLFASANCAYASQAAGQTAPLTATATAVVATAVAVEPADGQGSDTTEKGCDKPRAKPPRRPQRPRRRIEAAALGDAAERLDNMLRECAPDLGDARGRVGALSGRQLASHPALDGHVVPRSSWVAVAPPFVGSHQRRHDSHRSEAARGVVEHALPEPLAAFRATSMAGLLLAAWRAPHAPSERSPVALKRMLHVVQAELARATVEVRAGAAGGGSEPPELRHGSRHGPQTEDELDASRDWLASRAPGAAQFALGQLVGTDESRARKQKPTVRADDAWEGATAMLAGCCGREHAQDLRAVLELAFPDVAAHHARLRELEGATAPARDAKQLRAAQLYGYEHPTTHGLDGTSRPPAAHRSMPGVGTPLGLVDCVTAAIAFERVVVRLSPEMPGSARLARLRALRVTLHGLEYAGCVAASFDRTAHRRCVGPERDLFEAVADAGLRQRLAARRARSAVEAVLRRGGGATAAAVVNPPTADEAYRLHAVGVQAALDVAWGLCRVTRQAPHLVAAARAAAERLLSRDDDCKQVLAAFRAVSDHYLLLTEADALRAGATGGMSAAQRGAVARALSDDTMAREPHAPFCFNYEAPLDAAMHGRVAAAWADSLLGPSSPTTAS